MMAFNEILTIDICKAELASFTEDSSIVRLSEVSNGHVSNFSVPFPADMSGIEFSSFRGRKVLINVGDDAFKIPESS